MRLESFKKDLVASLAVFIVAIPLSLGIAMASGANIEAGLIAAAIGGIFVGLLSGSPLMVSGPAAGLTVLAFEIVDDYGLMGLGAATVVGGLVQLVMGGFKLGWVFQLIPKSILKGMLAAIGAIILVNQLHIMMGVPLAADPLTGLSWLSVSIQVALEHEHHIISPVFFCGLLTILVMWIWPKAFRHLKWIPGALPGVIFATFVSLFWEMERLSVESLLPFMGRHINRWDEWVLGAPWLGIIGSGIGLGLVASAESLLTARATDLLAAKRDPGSKYQSNLDRELFAQGAGNLASGLVGGLPISGVIVRSSANVDAGAETRLSTILHGVWVLAFVLVFPVVLGLIPYTALAAVLVVTGFKLLDLKGVKALFQEGSTPGFLWMVTFISIIGTNLLLGLGIALVVGLLAKWKEALAWLREQRLGDS